MSLSEGNSQLLEDNTEYNIKHRKVVTYDRRIPNSDWGSKI